MIKKLICLIVVALFFGVFHVSAEDAKLVEVTAKEIRIDPRLTNKPVYFCVHSNNEIALKSDFMRDPTFIYIIHCPVIEMRQTLTKFLEWRQIAIKNKVTQLNKDLPFVWRLRLIDQETNKFRPSNYEIKVSIISDQKGDYDFKLSLIDPPLFFHSDVTLPGSEVQKILDALTPEAIKKAQEKQKELDKKQQNQDALFK